MIREPSAELRAVIREYVDKAILPQQNYACSLCLEPLGKSFTVRVDGDEITRSDAVCQGCASKAGPSDWSWLMPNLP